MSKIKGKFAPLMDELCYDPRFKSLTDLEKMMYMLVILTCHVTHHQAPTDPRYYQLQYGVWARSGRIVKALCTLTATFPNLRCNDKKLSLIKSATYRNEDALEEELETELDIERRTPNKTSTFTAAPSPPSKAEVGAKTKFGESGAVLLTEAEHSKLVQKFGQAGAEAKITRLENYVLSKGKQYKSHYHTILSWENNRQDQRQSNVPVQSKGKRKLISAAEAIAAESSGDSAGSRARSET